MATTRKATDPIRDQFVDRDAEAKRIFGFDPLDAEFMGLDVDGTAQRFRSLPTVTDADGTVLVQKQAVERFEKDEAARERKKEMEKVAEEVLWENLAPTRHEGSSYYRCDPEAGSPVVLRHGLSRFFDGGDRRPVEVPKPARKKDLDDLRWNYRWGLTLTALTSLAALGVSIFAAVS